MTGGGENEEKIRRPRVNFLLPRRHRPKPRTRRTRFPRNGRRGGVSRVPAGLRVTPPPTTERYS
jgi:hypothetical protein